MTPVTLGTRGTLSCAINEKTNPHQAVDMPPELNADERLAVATARLTLAERILRIFRIERFTYLTVSVITCAVLIWAGYQMLSQPSARERLVGLMFGSAGVVSLSIARLLMVFNKVFKAVLGV